jgi:hypothetical protein
MTDTTIEIEGSLTDRSLKFLNLLQPLSGATFEHFVMSALDGLTRTEWKIDRLSDKRFRLSRDTATASAFTYEYVLDYVEAFTDRFKSVNEFGFAKVETITIWGNGQKVSHVFGPSQTFFRIHDPKLI